MKSELPFSFAARLPARDVFNCEISPFLYTAVILDCLSLFSCGLVFIIFLAFLSWPFLAFLSSLCTRFHRHRRLQPYFRPLVLFLQWISTLVRLYIPAAVHQ